MDKTDKQLLLEAQQGKDISEILRHFLEQHRGRKHIAAAVGIDLGVSAATLYQWLEDCDINIDDYKQPVAVPTSEAQG